MTSQILPITGLDKTGVILDAPAVSIAPNAFSDCRNVRFRDNTVSKMEGEVNIFPEIFTTSDQVGKYVVWWPNPKDS